MGESPMASEISAMVPLGVDIAQLGVLALIFRRMGQHNAAIKSLRTRIAALEEAEMASGGRADD